MKKTDTPSPTGANRQAQLACNILTGRRNWLTLLSATPRRSTKHRFSQIKQKRPSGQDSGSDGCEPNATSSTGSPKQGAQQILQAPYSRNYWRFSSSDTRMPLLRTDAQCCVTLGMRWCRPLRSSSPVGDATYQEREWFFGWNSPESVRPGLPHILSTPDFV